MQGNLFDYLDWRGDLSFSADPFGEADSLLMAVLSYIEYDQIFADLKPGEKVGIEETARRFFETHTEEEIQKHTIYLRRLPYLLAKMAQCPRYRDLKFSDYINIFSTERGEQLAAVAIEPGDGSVYASFRGTDESITGWKEDFKLSYAFETDGQKHAVRWLSERFKDAQKIRVGGHSKGGNFAVFAAAFCDRSVQEQIVSVDAYDAPGFIPEVVASEEYRRILDRVHSYVPQGSIVGQLMYRGTEDDVVLSTAKGFLQHDALSWQILRNSFIRSQELSDTSEFTDRMITEWLEKLEPKEREALSNSIFEMVESTGAESVTDLNISHIKNYLEMFRNFRKMDPEEQEQIKTTVSALFSSARHNVKAQLPSASELLGELKSSAARKMDRLGDVMLRAADSLIHSDEDKAEPEYGELENLTQETEKTPDTENEPEKI